MYSGKSEYQAVKGHFVKGPCKIKECSVRGVPRVKVSKLLVSEGKKLGLT